MPIKIDFLANVRDFVRGTGDAEEALDDVADSLDDMAADAKKGGRDAERAVERLEDGFRDAARRARDLGDAGKDAGKDVDDGMERAGEGLDEFKDEANSTAREAAASFDGSAESIADMFQEVAANAFAGFGPAGAVAGLAAAAGIGLAVAGFDDVQEANEKAAELASEWADRYVESGQRVATAAQQAAQIVAISTDPELFKEATENAELWGTSLETAQLAMSGNVAAAKLVEDALDRKRIATEKDTKAAQDAAQAAGGTLSALTPMEVELDRAQSAWRRHTDAMDAGAAQADAASDALLRLVSESSDAAVAVDELGNSVVTLPDGAEIFIDAKTGKATADVSRFKQDADGVIDHLNGREVVLRARADTSRAARELESFLNQKRTLPVTARLQGRMGGWD